MKRNENGLEPHTRANKVRKLEKHMKKHGSKVVKNDNGDEKIIILDKIANKRLSELKGKSA